MIQGLPERVRQDTDHHVRLSPAAVVMPHRAQEQLALEHPEGMLHHRQLDVGLPELLGGPTLLIAPQQVGSIARQGRPELLPVPGPVHPRWLGLRHGDGHERARLGEPALEPTHTLEDLVAALEPTALDPRPELHQGTCQPAALAAADGTFLLTPGPAPCQEIVHAPSLEQLHRDIGVVRKMLPPAGAQVPRKPGQFPAPRGQEIPPAAPAQKRQRLRADHAPVHDPDPV